MATTSSFPPLPKPVQHLAEAMLHQDCDVAFIFMDPRGVVVGWQGGAERVFGYTAEDMIGRTLDVIFDQPDRNQGLATHELAVAAARSRADDDRWHVRKDGTRIWASGVTSALHGESGAVMGFVKVVRDRTDVKAQLDALIHRSEALATAAEERSLFLRSLGHELRNPLAPLTAASALLRRVGDVPATQVPLAVIGRQIAVIQRLADDLSDLTRLDNGRLALQVQAVSLHEMLQALIEDHVTEAQRRGLQLQLLLPHAPIELSADPARLRQVLTNLLHNALKYTPAGGTIWVKATVEVPHAVVRVEDTGMGIAAEALPRIFELFTQENPDAGPTEGGMGIGLALVAELVRMHGGLVEVRSPGKGKGSEFTVRLPLQPSAPAAAPARHF